MTGMRALATGMLLLAPLTLPAQETPLLVSPAARGVLLRWVWGNGERPAGYFVERRAASSAAWVRITPQPRGRIRDRAAARALLGDQYERYSGLLFPSDPRAERRDPESFRGMLLLSADLEPVIGPRERQLVEEHARQLVVVVLAGVDEHLSGTRPQPVRNCSGLHKLRPVSYDREYSHRFRVRTCLDMSTILDNVRGTVQGVLAGVGHVIWYVDWQTGGQSVRQR